MTSEPCTDMPAAAFAIPGDITTLTGGYIYERRLLEGLAALGHPMQHIQLGASFPDPTSADMRDAIAQLTSLPPETPLILDGLVYGSIDTEGLAKVVAPIIAMIHHPLALESGLDEVRKAHLYATERANLQLARHVLVPSPHTAGILVSDYGVDEARITIARPGTDRHGGRSAPIDPPLILSVGIQHRRKGHDVLLRALGMITDLDWQAVVIGGPYDRHHAKELQALLKSLALGKRAQLVGQIPEGEISGYYRAASIFALATRYEGYGIVFDEAMSYGLPIVTCNTGAVPQTVPEGAGILVPPDDPERFAVGLRELLIDRARRATMASQSAEAGGALPTWEDTAQIASRILRDLAP